MYHSAIAAISRRNDSLRNGFSGNCRIICFMVRINRSTTAILPCLPTAPKRGLMLRRRHQAVKPSHQNWLWWSGCAVKVPLFQQVKVLPR